MHRILQLNIGARMIVVFAVLLAAQAGIGYLGYKNLQEMHSVVDEFNSQILPSINLLLQADRDLQQLLVAERSMIFANAKSDVFQSLVEEYESNFAQVRERFEKYAALAKTQEELALIEAYHAAKAAWAPISKSIVDGRKEDSREGRRLALDLSLGQASESFEAMRDFLDKLTEVKERQAKNAEQASGVLVSNMRSQILWFCGIALAVGVALCVLLTRSITNPLGKAMQFATAVAAGDFGRQLKVRSSDEVGRVCQALQTIPATLENVCAAMDDQVTAVENGHLAQRADATAFPGEYAKLIANANTLAGVYTKLVDEVPMTIASLGADQKIHYLNRAGLDRIGMSLEEAGKYVFSDVFHPKDGNQATAKALQTGAQQSSETDCFPGGEAHGRYLFGLAPQKSRW